MTLRRIFRPRFLMIYFSVLCCVLPGLCIAQDKSVLQADSDESAPAAQVSEQPQSSGFQDPRIKILADLEKTFVEPRGMKALADDGRIWVDIEKNRVVIDGYFCLDAGQLEMFACPSGTKEHESIVATLASSKTVHAALLAVGAQTGKPTQFEPYQPASGSTIEVSVFWPDKNGNVRNESGQYFIRHAATERSMSYDWVFGGSRIYRDAPTGQTYYLGDDGELICVSNFTTATMDIAVRSVDSNVGLLFEAYEQRLPGDGTPARIVLHAVNRKPFTGAGDVDLTAPKPIEK